MSRKPPALTLSAVSLLAAFALLAGCSKKAATAAADPTPTPAPVDEPAMAAGHVPGAAAGLPGTLPGVPGAMPGAATTGSPSPAFDIAKIPAVAARVDGAAITRDEVLQRAGAMREQMARMGAPPPPASEEFYHAMVDQLIGSRLLLAEAKKHGLMPTQAELQAGLDKLKSRNPQELARQMAAQGITEKALLADMAQSLAIQKLIDAEVKPAVKVSDEEAHRFYEQNPDRMKRPPQVRVRHLLVAVPQSAAAAQKQAARQKAEGLLARIKAGGDFAAIARESSDDTGSRNDGGLLPWFSRGEMVPPFEQAAFALKTGQTSGVVESPFGFHVLRLEDQRPAAAVPFEEAKPQIEQFLSRQQARELLDRKVAALRKAAKVEVLF
ncbi:MAG TPA: peptidylprolyl isomerase [Thermoanaerobaculia bacterium]|nr:peptidylprolyl isomerase [Thermoanaerobaculia bacterium]